MREKDPVEQDRQSEIFESLYWEDEGRRLEAETRRQTALQAQKDANSALSASICAANLEMQQAQRDEYWARVAEERQEQLEQEAYEELIS